MLARITPGPPALTSEHPSALLAITLQFET